MMNKKPQSIQEMILALEHFWQDEQCLLHQPYDMPMGAGTLHPATFFGVLGPKPCRIAYVQPCRRPADSRDGRHPNRLQRYLQFQVLIKPAPETPEAQEELYQLFTKSLDHMGLATQEALIRWHRDNWGSPMLGAKGVGWEVRCNGLEIAQYTYFQKMGGHPCMPCVEITYGIERVALCVQKQESIWNVRYGVQEQETYDNLYRRSEQENATYNIQGSDSDRLLSHLNRLLEAPSTGFISVDYEQRCLEPSHLFNILDARGRITHIMRPTYIRKVRNNAKTIAEQILQGTTFQPQKRIHEPRENTQSHSEEMALRIPMGVYASLPLWLVKEMMRVDFPDIVLESLEKTKETWDCSLKIPKGKRTHSVAKAYLASVVARLDDALYFYNMDVKNAQTYAQGLADVPYITSETLTLTLEDQRVNRQALLTFLWNILKKKPFPRAVLNDVVVWRLAVQQCKVVEEWPGCALFLSKMFLENASGIKEQEIATFHHCFSLVETLDSLAVLAICDRLKDGPSGGRQKTFFLLDCLRHAPLTLSKEEEKTLFNKAISGYLPSSMRKDKALIEKRLYDFIAQRAHELFFRIKIETTVLTKDLGFGETIDTIKSLKSG